MANYKHGVYIKETPTSLIPTVRVESAIPFVIGTAPVNQIAVKDRKVNKVVLINSYAEAVQNFGFEPAQASASGDKKFEHGLNEFMYANFNFYGIVPCIFVNVLDPAVHKTAVAAQVVTIEENTATLKVLGMLPESVVITNGQSGDDLVTYEAGTDYELAFDDSGYLVINWISSELPADITVSGNKIDASLVTKANIIGGITVATGARKGLELINEVYPKLRLVPTLIVAPGFSSDPEVAAIMAAKAVNINGNFKAMALCDAPATSETCPVYSSVPEWKNQNNLVLTQQILCWPHVRNTETIYHCSVHLAGVIGVTDNANGGVPYCSPSNKNLAMTGMCLEDGTEVVIGNEEANYLNGQGIATLLNFSKGWTFWGNRTCCYPGNTDPKDAFIPVRRMFQWVGNTIVLTIFQKVDEPGNRRLIDTVVNSLNQWLNSLTARQQLLGGRVEFREEDNPTIELMDGIYHFKVYITSPSPAEVLEFDLEIDTAYYSTLFDE